MISAFQSCEFRFGLKMSREQLEQVKKLSKEQNMQMRRQQKQEKEAHTSLHLPAVHLSSNFLTVSVNKDIGNLHTW